MAYACPSQIGNAALSNRLFTAGGSEHKCKRSIFIRCTSSGEDSSPVRKNGRKSSGGKEPKFFSKEELEKWILSRPVKGFGGQSEELDLSLEEKLLEQIKTGKVATKKHRSRAIAKPRETSAAPEKEPPPIPPGTRVLVSSLPRKQNIARDLKAAFGPTRGLIFMKPLTSGNKKNNEKTKEPFCDGRALLVFSNLKEAVRFVDQYNGAPLAFGRVEKIVACRVVDEGVVSRSPKATSLEGLSELESLERAADEYLLRDEEFSTEDQLLLTADHVAPLGPSGYTVQKLPLREKPKMNSVSWLVGFGENEKEKDEVLQGAAELVSSGEEAYPRVENKSEDLAPEDAEVSENEVAAEVEAKRSLSGMMSWQRPVGGKVQSEMRRERLNVKGKVGMRSGEKGGLGRGGPKDEVKRKSQAKSRKVKNSQVKKGESQGVQEGRVREKDELLRSTKASVMLRRFVDKYVQ